jgi:hypothetical protein
MPDIKGEDITIHFGEDVFDNHPEPIKFNYCAECAKNVLIPRGHNVEPRANINGLQRGQQIKVICIVCKQPKCINWMGETISDPLPKLDEKGQVQVDENTGEIVLHRHGDCETCKRVIFNPPQFPDLEDICGYWLEQNQEKIPQEIAKRVNSLIVEKEKSPEEVEWQKMVEQQSEWEAQQALESINADAINDFVEDKFLPESPEFKHE